MKPFISQMMLAAAFVCVAGSASAQATYAWAIATSDQEQQEVNIAKYVTRQEVVAEGKTCHRILVFNKSHVPGNAEDMFLQTRYGFREEGRKVFVYDFETGQERVALDYTLAPGDPFTTYNGENWVITAARDTLIKDYGFGAQGYEKEHRLLEVRNTADGRTDTWLEGFGSFAHHLLIEQPAAGSLLLWVFDESPGEGTEHYIAREISADPLFAHDTGWMEGGDSTDPTTGLPVTTATLKGDTLILTDRRNRWPSRYYTSFYRKGDDLYVKEMWEFQPYVDDHSQTFWHSDVACFRGLPAPASGAYTLHLAGDQTISTRISPAEATLRKPTRGTFDLQGRKAPAKPLPGIYVQDGQKHIIAKARMK